MISFAIISYLCVSYFDPKYEWSAPKTKDVQDFFRFHVIGDFGLLELRWAYPILPGIIVANSMNEYAKKSPISAVFTVGDNFYSDTRFQFKIQSSIVMENIFNGEYIKNLPWYLIYGNHDCQYHDYFGKSIEKRYPNMHMPSGPWNMTVPIGNHTIEFIFLTCTLPCYGDLHDEDLEKECKKSYAEYNKSTEYDWLNNHLQYISEDPNVLWKFVFMHYPLFSISRNDGDNETLKQNLFPLLKQYGIDVVFAGHNHNMQYLTSTKYSEGNEYKQMNKIDLCEPDSIMCHDEKTFCKYRNDSCDYDPSVNCSDKYNWFESREFDNNVKNVTYKKGQELHQVTMGSSGANLDILCLHLNSPMANDIFGLSEYGFSEVTVTESEFKVKYIHANSSEVVFESTIVI